MIIAINLTIQNSKWCTVGACIVIMALLPSDDITITIILSY